MESGEKGQLSVFGERGLKETIARLTADIQELYRADRIPWVVGYSGGKDSTATLQIVWLALSKDVELMGCGFPKEMRQAAVEAEPDKFQLPSESDMRFNWIHVCLDAIDADEMRDLVEEAWSRAVPLYVAQEYGRARGYQ